MDARVSLSPAGKLLQRNIYKKFKVINIKKKNTNCSILKMKNARRSHSCIISYAFLFHALFHACMHIVINSIRNHQING